MWLDREKRRRIAHSRSLQLSLVEHERIVLMISGQEPKGNSKEAIEEMMPQIARFTLSFCSFISISIEQDFMRDCDSASKLL